MDDSVESLASLCKYCSDIIHKSAPTKGPWYEQKYFGFFSTLEELTRSLNDRLCALCSAIHRYCINQLATSRLRGEGRQDNRDAQASVKIWLRPNHITKPHVPVDPSQVRTASGLTGESSDTNGMWIHLDILLEVVEEALRPASRMVIFTSPSTAQLPPVWTRQGGFRIADKYKMLKYWLARCQHSHPGCQRHTGSSKWSRSQPLPARLVRLGNGEDETAPTRLVLTSEEETSNKKIAYATLSHCWGDYQPLQTTTHTLLSFQARLPKEQTPRTFRDAMDICRAVGIQYLWIDSLCIVQDDNDDWCREAARMKDIYSGSLLTIAATGARNSSGGCFYDDSKEEEWYGYHWRNQVCQFNTPLLTAATTTNEELPSPDPGIHEFDGQGFSMAPRQPPAHLKVRMYMDEVTKRPEFTHLNTRGWVLQEQALSPRVVYCMQPEMHFICRTVNCTEAGASFVHAARDRVHWHNPTIRSLSEGMDPAHIHQVWSDWMEHYSRRSFTYPQDRLSAIAGLVEEYARYSGDEHLLGCWKRTVRQDLMWTRWRMRDDVRKAYLREGSERKALEGTPSWSHLSCPSRIRMGHHVQTPTWSDHLVLITANVVWDGAPLLSRLLHAELVVEAPVARLPLDLSWEMAENREEPWISLYTKNSKRDGYRKPSRHWTWHGCLDSPDAVAAEPATEYDCLLITSFDRCRFFILIVEEVKPTSTDSQTGIAADVQMTHALKTYRRIGASSYSVKKGCLYDITDAPVQRLRLV